MGAVGQAPCTGHGGVAALTLWWIPTGAPAIGWPAVSVTRATTGVKLDEAETVCPPPLTRTTRQADGSMAVKVRPAQTAVHAQAWATTVEPGLSGPAVTTDCATPFASVLLTAGENVSAPVHAQLIGTPAAGALF